MRKHNYFLKGKLNVSSKRNGKVTTITHKIDGDGNKILSRKTHSLNEETIK